jgi:geranylgeranyl reductase family protein
MRPPADADVVVVGAGPAGATTALALRAHRPDLHVVLVDRARFPRDKSCGDGLGPGVGRVLRELDALDVLAGAARPGAVRVGGPDGQEGRAVGPTVAGRDLSGHVLPRRVFDSRLVELARERGVEVHEGTRLVATEVTPDARTVTWEGPEGAATTRAGLVVAADGAYSRTRKAAGIDKAPAARTHIGTRVYADVEWPSVADAAELALRIDFEAEVLPGYGWVFPTSPTTANVGVGLPLDLLTTRKVDLRRMLDGYVTALDRRGVRVRDLRSPLGHQLPHAAALPRLAHDRLVLVGDAGSMINPLSGEGIAYAMEAALALGHELATGDDTAVATRRWERRLRRSLAWHVRSCWTSHRLLRSRRWASVVTTAAAHDQRVIEDGALMLFDSGRMRAGTALRIARSGVLGRRAGETAVRALARRRAAEPGGPGPASLG